MVGGAFGGGYTAAGEPSDSGADAAPAPGAFAGAGARAGLRVGLSLSPVLGVEAEVGYRNLLGPTVQVISAGEELVGEIPGDQLHLGYAALGATVRIDRLELGAGGVWMVGEGQVTGAADVALEDSYLESDYLREAASFAGDARLGGGWLRAGFDLASFGRAALAVELDGGAGSSGQRLYTWGTAGISIGSRR